jgi:hypothetical protein
MLKKDTKKKRYSEKDFCQFANTAEAELNSAYVAFIRAIAKLSNFADRTEYDRTKVWQIFCKSEKCDELEIAEKEFTKAVKGLKNTIKSIEEKHETLNK